MKSCLLVGLLVIAGLAGGCLSKPSLLKESFAFTAPASGSSVDSPGPVLGLQRIFVAPPFDRQPFTYRTSDVAFERDPYAGFLVPPAESLSEPIRAELRNAGLFSAITEPGTPLQPDLQAAISVTELYGDFRNPKSPAAVMNLRVLVFGNQNNRPGKVLLEKSYAERIPLPARTASALMTGWNQALQQIIKAFSADLKQVLQ